MIGRFLAVTAAVVVLVMTLSVGVAVFAAQEPEPVAAHALDCAPAAVALTGMAPGLDAAQQANARAVIGVALAHGLGEAGAAIGVAAALAESTLYNYANDGSSTLISATHSRQLNDAERATARESLRYPHDKVGNNLDSIGILQQRPMTGWGAPVELIDPTKSARKFFDRMVDVPRWQTQSPWNVAQAVQGSPSSDGGIYRDSHTQAVNIVASFTATGGSGTASPAVLGRTDAPRSCIGGPHDNTVSNGSDITLPRHASVAPAVAGRTITAPNAQLAQGLVAGFDALGLPYVWGGGGSGAGPNNGCPRGNGQLNSCGNQIGFDCSGLTAYVLGQAGYTAPGNSGSQRDPARGVPWDQGLPGDIVGFPGHVAIYLGTIDGTRYILEASTIGTPVHIVPLTRDDHDAVLYRYWS